MKLVAASLLLAAMVSAQTPPPPVVSPQVNPDRTITFRYPFTAASKVEVHMDWLGDPLPMAKGADGIWSVTTKPLPPEIYGYSLSVDGRSVFDPGNLHVVPNLSSRENWVEVPGDRPQPWDVTPVPHGEIHRHLYTSKAIKGLTADQEPYLVYTPPGYSAHAIKPYPVLYLLHGWSETENGWITSMNADAILDNLLAEGKIKPMVVVMPLGYGDMNFMRSFDVWNHKPEIDHNTSLYSEALLTEILPAVEHEYHVATDREHRAIAGLSMGGLEALTIGLEHTSQFAWVGGFSSAVHAFTYPDPLPGLDPKKADLRLLWIGCGLSDGLLEPNRKLEKYLKGVGLQMTVVEIPGGHVAEVWRQNLIEFAPLLFR